ncbi:MAG: amino acid permease, partial [Candidatus Acidiferrales bacterium]
AAMAEDGYLPRWLAALHPRYGTPARAIAISTVIYCALATSRVTDLVNVYIWTRIATSMLTLLSSWRLRQKMPDARRTFRIPGGAPGLSSVILFPAILCGIKIYYSEPYVFRWAPWLLASGPVAYAILRWIFGLKPTLAASAPNQN